MTSEAQVAANRRNATKSTGPRSARGKNRVSRNALRHGLSLGLGHAEQWNKDLDQHARELANGCSDQITLGYARITAEADLELARIRRLKTNLVVHVTAFGALDPPRMTSKGIIRWLKQYDEGGDPPLSLAMEGIPPAMPVEEPERSVEAIRRVLPELLKLDRYERRAAARRDRALRRMCERKRELSSP
jgi:hypothetical protein